MWAPYRATFAIGFCVTGCSTTGCSMTGLTTNLALLII